MGLTNASDYEIEVRGFCSSGYPGPWSTTYIFSTDNSCTSPQNLISSNVTSTSAQLNWTAQSNVLYYQTRYRVQGGGSWTNGTSNTNSKVISGLQSSTSYDWQVRAVCLPSPYSTSSWSIPADR
ncbi:MAG: fibronectin type III domain-containing protein [Bacteroidota bacterium]|nr:MAG: fibronectin type III domain-containing protein [Bacteroidota bacterium]